MLLGRRDLFCFSFLLVWIVNVGQEEASKVQEHDEMDHVADCRKWIFSSNTNCRNHILHDVEGHQEGKEESRMVLHSVCGGNTLVIILLDTLLNHPDSRHKG